MAKTFDDLVKRTTTKKTRQRAEVRTGELLDELLLSEIRKLAGKSQRQVADALGIKQPSLSKLEKQMDMQISTLRRIVCALGGELEIFANFPNGKIKIGPFSEAGQLSGAGQPASGESRSGVTTSTPDRKSTRLNSSHMTSSRMPSSA